MAPSLPEKVILQIISRLPPANAIQLCCMSKDWLSKLTSSQFRSLHFDNFTRSGDKSKLFWRLKFDHVDIFVASFGVVERKNLLHCHSQCAVPYSVVGVVNGVVCLANTHNGDICIWNPIIKINIPVPPDHNLDAPIFSRRNHRSLGFAYDEESKEYRIFSAFTYGNENEVPILGQLSLDVFSLRSRGWTKIPLPEDLQCAIVNSSSAVFMEDCCHWLVYRMFEDEFPATTYVMCVDASDYSISWISLPEGIPMRMYGNTIMATLTECLALIPERPVGDPCMNVWIMEEYGEESSWTMRYKVVGEVDTFEAIFENINIIIRGGTVLLPPLNAGEGLPEVMLCDRGHYYQRFSESLEFFGEGEPFTCFCP